MAQIIVGHTAERSVRPRDAADDDSVVAWVATSVDRCTEERELIVRGPAARVEGKALRPKYK